MSNITHNATRALPPMTATPLSPFISVVMPVRNEERAIGETLHQLLKQDYDRDRFEVLVIDGGSTDRTREIVERLVDSERNIVLLDNPRRWSSAARNVGIAAARGDYLVIVDGHCEVASTSYFKELSAAFARTGAECLGRPQPLETASPNRLQRAISLARSSRLGHHPASEVFSSQEKQVPAHSVAVAYRRHVFERVGMFDESFDACEDVELNHRIDRAGLVCVLAPALRVGYHPRESLGALFRQMNRYGRGRMRLLRKHPNTFSLLGFGPALLLLFIIVGPVVAWKFTSFLSIYAAVVGGYATVLVIASAIACRRARQWNLFGLLMLVFATLHLSAGFGLLVEAFKLPSGQTRSTNSRELKLEEFERCM